MRRITVAALLTALALTGCQPSAPEPAEASIAYGPKVVHLDGLGDLRFGQSAEKLGQGEPGSSCAATTSPFEGATPVVVGGRIVLMWVEPPVATPEGITVGTPLSTVRAAYPQAVELKAPKDSYRFDGLLMADGGRAYLFLHDGETVRKTIAGFEDYARRLFDNGFGTC